MDMGILPDVLGARWAYALHNKLDERDTDDKLKFLKPQLTTARGDSGEPLAVLELHVEDRDELADLIRQAFARTCPDGTDTPNDYTNSILQSGVKEPLMLVVLKVVFGKTMTCHYLMAIDGNSRLASLWKARTGGGIDTAASACIEAVLGTHKAGGAWKPLSSRHLRDRVESLAKQVTRGLRDTQLTASTIRTGQTLIVPAVVVVGTSDGNNAPLKDLVAARDDMLATIHTDTTPWTEEAQAERGMSRVLRRAVSNGLITAQESAAVEGLYTAAGMHAETGLPPHRLWAAALTLQLVLARWGNGMGDLFCEEFNLVKPSRLSIGSRVAATALCGYRSTKNVRLAVNAFSNGGPITDDVRNFYWGLDHGRDPITVLDQLLERALDNEWDATAQLSVLGGIAGMLEGLISRDRGSKVSGEYRRAVGRTPFRVPSYRVVQGLAETAGGKRILHSLAVSHVRGSSPKLFHTDGEQSGEPVVDAVGAQASIEMEWDIVEAAYPKRAMEERQQARVQVAATYEPADVQLRRELRLSSAAVHQATMALVRMKRTHGPSVFGPREAVEEIQGQLTISRDLLMVHGPAVFEDDLAEHDDDTEVQG
ncbi:hypothetical protein [Nocardia tengchongensis]|uniref:hypothetical protein n=1 Tax=Nocardia tengchongensis TaxID=2055889 RepID=UPI003697DDF5